MKIGKFATDGQLAVEGIWEDIGEGFKVRVARMNNPKYRDYIRKRARAQARTYRRVGSDFDDLFKLQQEAVAQHVLLEWTGLENDDGDEISYSPQKALELFETHPDLYDLIVEIASDAELFRREAQEEATGKSLRISSGSSSGEST